MDSTLISMSLVEKFSLFNTFITVPNIWAEARIQGMPTADEKSLDADVIICAQYKLLELEYPGRYIVIATTNVDHLSRFADQGTKIDFC